MTERGKRKRQRSLRVPVDDVPRQATEESAELEMLVEPEPESAKAHSAAPPPPAPPPPAPPAPQYQHLPSVMFEDEPALAVANDEAPETRTTDPGTSSAPEDETVELGAPMALDVATTELEGEPTHVAVEARAKAPSIDFDPDDSEPDGTDAVAELAGEPTRELVLPDEPPPPPPPAPAPRRASGLPPPGGARPVTVPPPAGTGRPTSVRPADKPPSMPPPAKPASVRPPPPASVRPPAPEASETLAASTRVSAPSMPSAEPTTDVVRTSSPGAIVVGRTIAIGVGAPTHTTTAEERKSLPPPPAPSSRSEPPPSEEAPETEPTEGAAAAGAETEAPEVVLEVGVEGDGDDEPVVSAARDEFDEELAAEELEEASSPGIQAPRSLPPAPAAPPKPPAAAPPPPAGSAAAPAGAPPPPPTGLRAPPKPPERKAPPPAAAAAAPVAAAEPDTTKRARRKWWEELFNDDYLRTVPIPHPRVILRQTDFMESRLGLTQGATVLDVGCGLGLHAIELTRRGYFTVGLDLSLPMLSRAADEARDQGLKINFVQGDMREMSFDGAFDAVVSWGTSFGYFDDDANRALVERFHRALKPGGLLLLDVVNRDYVLRTQPNNCWFQGDGCIVMEESQLNFITSRLAVKRQVMLDDGRQQDTSYSIRLYSLHELGQILHLRGFRVVEVSGLEATPGVFFGAESPRLLIVAERRPDAVATKKSDSIETGPHEALPTSQEPPADAPPPAPSGNGGGEPA